MTTYSVNAGAVTDFLNRLSGMSPSATAAGFLTPQSLELAVAQFCGYEIYTYESLSLLDSFTCTSVSIWKSLEDDGFLEGSATISGVNAGSSLQFQTPRFTWMPLDANGNPISNNYRAASGGDMRIVTHQNSIIDVQSTVLGYPGYMKLIQEVAPPSPPPSPSPSDDDDEVQV